MLNPGAILQNRYRIISLLGQGGMGAVYRAWDLTLNIPVAVKEMIPQPGINPSTLSGLRQQFYREAQVLARLNHPNLVRVTNYFEEGGNAYLVMDFVEGESLADLIAKRGALPQAQVIAWAAQILDALAYCHSQGVIHRDIKPQNIIIRPDGRPVLVDFGLVKLWDPRDPHTQTVIRGMGTPEYAPPEQYEALGSYTDPRSDIYSLGATLYHALVGFAPATFTQRILSTNSLVPPRQVLPGLDSDLERAILKAMEIRPENRFQSATEMMRSLNLQRLGPSGPPTIPVSAQRKKPVILLAAALIIGLVLCAGIIWQVVRLPQAWLRQAERLREGGLCDKAVVYYQRVLQISQRNVTALAGLGQCLEVQGDYQRALQVYQRWASVTPNEPEALFGIGRSYLLLGDYESARSTFSETIRIAPDRPESWSGLAETYVAEGLYDDGFRVTQEMLAKGFVTESVRLLETMAAASYEPSLLKLSDWYARQKKSEELKRINAQIQAQIPNPQAVNLDNRVLFLGYRFSALPDGQTQLDLYFQALDELPLEYVVFLHAVPSDPSLLSEDRRKYGFANYDHHPPQPTTEWVQGAIYKDSTVFKAAPGAYRFRFGLYHPPSSTYITRLTDGKKETYLEWELIDGEHASADQLAFFGWRQYEAGHIERARQIFEQSLSKDNKNMEALLGLSLIYAQFGGGDLKGINQQIQNLISHPLEVRLEDKLQFLGYDMKQSASGEFALKFYFKVLDQVGQDFYIWVHAHPRNPIQLSAGRQKFGFENLDFKPEPPTSAWVPGAVIRAWRPARLSPGEWQFYFGFWNPETQARLKTAKGETSIDIGWIKIE